MTKVLDVETGEFLLFVSSQKYDLEHPEDASERVIIWEDSYGFSVGDDLNDRLKHIIISGEKDIGSFEIIYD